MKGLQWVPITFLIEIFQSLPKKNRKLTTKKYPLSLRCGNTFFQLLSVTFLCSFVVPFCSPFFYFFNVFFHHGFFAISMKGTFIIEKMAIEFKSYRYIIADNSSDLIKVEKWSDLIKSKKRYRVLFCIWKRLQSSSKRIGV